MKKIISLLLAVLMVFGTCLCVSAVDIKAVNEGNYVCTKEIATKVADSEKAVTTATYKYDSLGRVIEINKETVIDDDIDETEIFTLKYKDDCCIEEKTVTSYGSTTKTTVKTNTFDKNGRLTKFVILVDGEKSTIEELKYDSYGNVTYNKKTYCYSNYDRISEITAKVTNGKITSQKTVSYTTEANSTKTETSVTYTYTKDGLPSKVVNIPSSDAKRIFTYTYNSKGVVTKVVRNDIVGKDYNAKNIAEYKYDKNGNITNVTSYTEGSNTKYVDNLTYDSNGRLTKRVNNYSTLTYTYAKNGTLTSKTENNNGIVTTTKYEYKASKAKTYKSSYFNYALIENGNDYDVVVYPDATDTYQMKVLANGRDYTVTEKEYNGKIALYVAFFGDFDYSENTLIVTDKNVPTSVKGLKVDKATTKSITLKWSKYDGAKKYKVEKSTDGKKWSTAGTSTKNSITISKLSAGKTYKFRVTALNSSGKAISLVSSVIKAGTLTSAPSLKLASNKSKTAVASWKKVTGASKYVVYKSTDGKKFAKVGTTTKATYTLSKLSAGKKVYVKVVAVNVNGLNSAASSVKNVTVKK